MLEEIKHGIAELLDITTLPLAYFSALYMRFFRRMEMKQRVLRRCKHTFLKVGVWPLIDHYYEPMFNPAHLRHSLRDERKLPGLNLNQKEQIHLLEQFDFAHELDVLPISESTSTDMRFYYNNPSYGTGDSEYLYSIIRFFKPQRIIEIGSGFSTLMAIEAVNKNQEEAIESGSQYNCTHICIEPYEMPWLEKTNAIVIRKKLEEVDPDLFLQLKENDILFIDSSHIIRPQGDVLVECMEILPILNTGVLVHFHDIFTPRDYLDEWIFQRTFLWNEQYLLEAFLSFNNTFEVIGAVNYLKHNHYTLLKQKCPMITEGREPGAFWIRRK